MNRLGPGPRSGMWLFVALLLPWGVGPAMADESAQSLALKAQRECDEGRQTMERHVRLAHFERGESLAEQALARNERLPEAHFAMFCSLGEQMRIDGESISSVFGFRKVMRHLDRTLELNPDHLDAMSSKGTFLVRLPVLFGGDVDKGEQMLRRVIERDPSAINARLALAKSYAARGNKQEALTLASEAHRLAHSQRRLDLIPDAEATVSSLKGAPSGRMSATP